MSAITAVTVQNSLGVSGFYELPPERRRRADRVGGHRHRRGGGEDRHARVGGDHRSGRGRLSPGSDVQPLVVDPVAASQHGDALLRPDALDALRSLILPLATLVTPNLGEVRLLTGITVIDLASAREAALALHELGPSSVLVKGGHLPSGDAIDLLYDGSSFLELTAPRRATDHTHGSGDTLAASITAALARGLSLPDAVRAGKAYITSAVADSYPLGAGLGPVGHFWRIRPLDLAQAIGERSSRPRPDRRLR